MDRVGLPGIAGGRREGVVRPEPAEDARKVRLPTPAVLPSPCQLPFSSPLDHDARSRCVLLFHIERRLPFQGMECILRKIWVSRAADGVGNRTSLSYARMEGRRVVSHFCRIGPKNYVRRTSCAPDARVCDSFRNVRVSSAASVPALILSPMPLGSRPAPRGVS